MRPLNSTRGSALLVALMFSAILAISLTSYLKLALNSGSLANRSFHLNAAQNIADAGLERVLWSLNNEYLYASPTNWTTGGFSARTGFSNEYQGTFPSSSTYYSLAGNAKGQVKVWVGDYNATSHMWHAVAQATITLGDGTSLTKTAESYLQQRSYSELGMVARNGVSFNGNVLVDSWQSRPNPSDDIPYSNSVRRTEATIGSPSLISLQNADIYGYVSIGSSTIDSTGLTVGTQGRVAGSFSAAAGIDTTRVTCDFTSSFPDVNPAAAGSSIASITSNTSLSSGTYSVSSIALSGTNQDLHIGSASGPAADVTLTVNGNVTMSGGAKLYIYPGSTLKLYVSGDITMTGTSGVQNGTTSAPNNPDCFMLFGLRTEAAVAAGALMQDWLIRGTSYLSAVIFAPNADVEINGAGDSYGSVVGNHVDMIGNGNFHYDESLMKQRLGSWRLLKWRELSTASDRATYVSQLTF